MRRILLATDLTDGANNALGRAIAMTREARAELRIFHALPPWAESGERLIARAKLRDQIAALAGAATADLDLAIRVPVADPAAGILSEAERFDADLIILGRYGEPNLRDAIFGTTASHVVQAATRPVLIAQTDHIRPYATLLAAIDDSSAEEVLRLALGVGSVQDLHVVHAHEPGMQRLFGGGDLLEDVRADQQAMTRDVLDVVRAFRRSAASPRVHNIVEEGDAIDVIMQAWMDVKPDLLVMGTHGRVGLGRLLRGHAHLAMLGCTSDILVVRTGAGD